MYTTKKIKLSQNKSFSLSFKKIRKQILNQYYCRKGKILVYYQLYEDPRKLVHCLNIRRRKKLQVKWFQFKQVRNLTYGNKIPTKSNNFRSVMSPRNK